MIINFTGRGTTIKDLFKQTVEKKLKKFERFFGDEAKADVKVINEGGRETVEITINSEGMIFRAERTSDDRLTSLDAVVDALFRQITKNKQKLRTQMKRDAFDAAFNEEFAVFGQEMDESNYKIVKSKRFSLKPMDVEEAILQMNLLGHSFFLFLNAQTEEVSLVYKRNDGDYGFIEPTV